MKNMTKKLIAYFSASGVTRKAAESLAEITGADLYEIRPAVPYSKADLDWKNPKSRSSIEMTDPTFRPALADTDANIHDYDVIFVGFPIWWYVAPTIINTFLESYDFTGKTIVPFATSGSSGIEGAIANLRNSVGASIKIVDGELLNGDLSEEELEGWAKNSGLEV
jgi:flavodoxin